MSTVETKEGFTLYHKDGASGKIVRITGSGFVKQGSITQGHPVEYRHWQDVIEDYEFAMQQAAHSEEDEAICDAWLENPAEFMERDETGAPKTSSLRRVMAGTGLQRGDAMQKQASAAWDQDFAEAQAHAAAVLGNIGNGRE
jgi:hypothetical protein